MKKKYKIILAIFFVSIIIMPFVVECIYRIGDVYPIFVLGFSQSDILGHFSSSVALMIALTALFYALSTDEPDLIFMYSRYIDDGKEFAKFCIANDGKKVLDIDYISLINKKGMEVILFQSEEDKYYGITVEAKFRTIEKIELSELRTKIIQATGKGSQRHLRIKVNLRTGKAIYENSKEMFKFFDEIAKGEI